MLRYFPPVSFDLGNDKRIEPGATKACYATADDGVPMSWDEVKYMTFNTSSFDNTLLITYFDKGGIGARAPARSSSRAWPSRKSTSRRCWACYWQRHQIMRAQIKRPGC